MESASKRRTSPIGDSARALIARAMSRRIEAGLLLAHDAERVAPCHAMAARIHRGGKLILFGDGGATADAQHVAVEFVHPVIVGKRALPAIHLPNDRASMSSVADSSSRDAAFAHQMRWLAAPDDIAMDFRPMGDSRSVQRDLEVARKAAADACACRQRGGAIATNPAVEFTFVAHCNDPMIVKEIQVTTYHILWVRILRTARNFATGFHQNDEADADPRVPRRYPYHVLRRSGGGSSDRIDGR